MMKIATLLALVAACGTDAAANPDASPDAAADAAADRNAPASAAPGCPAPTVVAVATGAEVTINGDTGSALGIFDPSIVGLPGISGGVVAYSSVPDQHSIRTRIAVSGDTGATWGLIGEANAPELAAIASSDRAECPTGTCVGLLISEVPSLVLDPSDPDSTRRWKLFAHRYLAEPNNTLHYRIGTITLQTASNPQGPWTPPEKLLGLSSPSPYTTQGARWNASTFPAMADCIALTEPGALWLPGSLELAMGCVYLDGVTPRIRIVLARSPDHGRTWAGVGPMLAPGDADCLPGNTPGSSVNAPNLVIGPDGNEYLAATGSSAAGYDGCLIYRVDNPATGHVAHGADGKVAPVRALIPDTGQFSGACAWNASTGGYQLDLGFLTAPRPFRIFRGGAAF